MLICWKLQGLEAFSCLKSPLLYRLSYRLEHTDFFRTTAFFCRSLLWPLTTPSTPSRPAGNDQDAATVPAVNTGTAGRVNSLSEAFYGPACPRQTRRTL